MATNFIDIYARAMTLLKSPVLTNLQQNDLYSFCMVMNQYLGTAITLYNPNVATESRIKDRTETQDYSASFIADGYSSDFIVSGDNTPTENSILKVVVDGTMVSDYSYDSNTNTLSLNVTPLQGNKVDLLWVNDGSFNSVTNEDITLLSMALCWAWAIQTQNNLLDIDRQPNDSDFKLHAEGTTIKGKIDWVKYYEEMFKRELSKADWRPFFRRGR